MPKAVSYKSQTSSLKEQLKVIQAKKAAMKDETEEAKNTLAILESILSVGGELDDLQKERLQNAKETVKAYDELNTRADRIIKRQKEIRDNSAAELRNNKEIDSVLNSIGNTLGENSDIYKLQKERLEKIKGITESVASAIENNKNLSEEEIDALNKIVDSYRQQGINLASISKQLAQKKITQAEAAKLAEEETERWKDIVSQFKLSGEAAEVLKEMLPKMVAETESFAKAAQKVQKEFTTLDNVMGSFSGIPAMNELNKLINTAKGNATALRVALFALGAAAGKALFDYFGAEALEGRKIGYEVDIGGLQQQQNILKDQIGVGIQSPEVELDPKFKGRNFLKEKMDLQLQGIDKTFEKETLPKLQIATAHAGQRAGIEFSAQFQQGAAQFKGAAATALYGEQLGPTSFQAGELQMAGIDPGQIVQSMSELATATGKVPTQKLAEDMAIMAKRTGQSSQSIAGLTEYFMRADNLSADTAINMVEGMRAMAKASNLDLGNLMQGVAEASKDALSYQIMSAEALTKQVAAAQSIGVNFNKLAGAGKNMVLNYKDSIKAEMQLSSMLGRSVNLSEVRQKAMSGDYTGMMEAMRAQGLDPSQMNMFQQQQLSQAMGGMDLETIQKIYKGEVTKPEDLTAGAAGAEGQKFLTKTKQAQASIASTSAYISAKSAELSAELEKNLEKEFIEKFGAAAEVAKAEQKIKEGQLQFDIDSATKLSNEYIRLAGEIAKLQIEQKAGDAFIQGGVGVASGLLTQYLGGKLFGIPGVTPGTNTGPGGNGNRRGTSGGNNRRRTTTSRRGPKGGAGAGWKAMAGGFVAGMAIDFLGNKLFGGNDSGEDVSSDQLDAQNEQTSATNVVADNVQTTNDLLAALCSCIGRPGEQTVNELKGLKEETSAGVKDFSTEGTPTVAGSVIQSAAPTLAYNAAFGSLEGLGAKTLVPAARNLVAKKGAEKLAVSGVGKSLLAGAKGGLGMGAGGGLSLAGSLIGVAGDTMKDRGLQGGDYGQYQAGQATSTVGKTLEFAGYGAMIGSIIPGIGTAVGGVVGGIIGGAVGLWNNYFSADAKKQEAEAKAAETERLRIEALNAQIGQLITIQEAGTAASNQQLTNADSMLSLAQNEQAWRASMLAQAIEQARLLNVISSGFVQTGPGGVLTDKLGNRVEDKNYNQTLGIQAKMGTLKYDNKRQEDIVKTLEAFTSAAGRGESTVQFGSGKMNLEEYKKKFGVSESEWTRAAEMSNLMKESQKNASTKQGANVNQSGATPTASTSGGTPTANATNQTTTTSTSTSSAAPSASGGIASVGSSELFINMRDYLRMIQTEANLRGIAVDTKLKEIYSGGNGLYNNTAYAVKNQNRLAEIKSALIDPNSLMNKNIDSGNKLLVSATNAQIQGQEILIDLMEANVELLGMIADNTDGDNTKGTTISLNGAKLGQMMANYSADRKGLLKNWNG